MMGIRQSPKELFAFTVDLDCSIRADHPLRRAGPIGRTTRPARTSAWHAPVWIALVVVGGLIGGACGGLAWGINKIVFAKTRNPIARHVVTGLISAAFVVVWPLIAAAFVAAIKRR